MDGTPAASRWSMKRARTSSRRIVRRALPAAFCLLVALAVAQPAQATGLVVQVLTNFIPGTELGWARATFVRYEDGALKPQNAAIDQWKHYSESSSWSTGTRIAEVASLPRGEYRGVVGAYDPNGGLLWSRPVVVNLLTSNVHVVSVLLTRDPLVTPPQVGVLPAIEVSHWTSEEVDRAGDADVEETKSPIQCPPNLAVRELACDANYCDNIQLTCRAFPGVSTQNHRWTAFFSEEAGSYQGCNANEMMTGIRCRGDFCDEISLRCTEHTGSEELCYTTDPISDGQPLIGEVPDNGYVKRILCEGSFCDDKRLEICRMKEFPLHLGAFSGLCVTSFAGGFVLDDCQSAAQGGNTAQVWALDDQTGQLVNPLTGTCLTALGGEGAVTEESCAEAGDTSWFLDANGRLSSIGPNNDPLCLTLAGVQDPQQRPPLGATFELGACSPALYQLFEPSNAGLPAPLPELDAGTGEILYLPTLPGGGWLVLAAALAWAGRSATRRVSRR